MKKFFSLILILFVCLLPLMVGAAADSVCLRWGDIDGDGNTSPADARLILRQSVNLENYPEEALRRCDFDRDDKITSADARFALRLSVGLEAYPAHETEEIPASPPTCTQTGLTQGSRCLICGEMTVRQETVPAMGHKAAVDKAVAPTCTEPGLTEGTHCSVCGATLVKQEAVPATGHKAAVDKAVPPPAPNPV